MNVEYSNKEENQAYSFSVDERLLIASLLKKHVKKISKKIDKLVRKYDGQATAARDLIKLLDIERGLELIIEEFSKTKSKS